MCIDYKEIIRGHREYKERETRDAMDNVASFLVSHFWGRYAHMTNGLGVLLLTWNNAFYRYGSFDFDALEQCLKKNFNQIEKFKKRNILSFSEKDEKNIKSLFEDFLKSLQVHSGKKKGYKSPVAVAKALHLLAPSFFPLWDYKIARAYKCYYNINPAQKYIAFCCFVD